MMRILVLWQWFLSFLYYYTASSTAFVPVVERSLRGRVSSSLLASNQEDDATTRTYVDQLLGLLDVRDNEDRDTDAISSCIQTLEEKGAHEKIDLDNLFDSYELVYFDKSIDGDRGSGNRNNKNSKKKRSSWKSKLLGKLFGLRYSLQHIVSPNLVVNDVGFKVFGIPLAIVAPGNVTKPNINDINIITSVNTNFRPDTALTIEFDKQPPLLWIGHPKWFPLIFRMPAKATSPAVTLCTTYVDDRIRLALASKGGRLAFTRVGQQERGNNNLEAKAATTHQVKKDWEAIYFHRKPLPFKLLSVVGVTVPLLMKLPMSRIPLTVLAGIYGMKRLDLIYRRRKEEKEQESFSHDKKTITLYQSLAKDDTVVEKVLLQTTGEDDTEEEDIMEGDEARDAWLDMVGDLVKEEEEEEEDEEFKGVSDSGTNDGEAEEGTTV